MNIETLQKVIIALKAKGIKFDKGLEPDEVSLIENRLGAVFPADLKAFLSIGLPVSARFPNWRGSVDEIMEQQDALVDGILFDIQENSFWYPDWGDRPAAFNNAIAVAKENLSHVPKLIPIYGHRFIPASPSSEGNPIFSIVQTDIICYGTNILNYFDVEFSLNLSIPTTEIREVPFWSKLVELTN